MTSVSLKNNFANGEFIFRAAVRSRRIFLCVILRAATKQAVRISTEAKSRGRGVYTPNLFGAMLLPVTQKLGANIPRLALLALAEIHSSRFVALLRMTLVRCVGVAVMRCEHATPTPF